MKLSGQARQVLAEAKSSKGMVLFLAGSVVCLLSLGVTLVWTNLERTKMAYSQTVLEKELAERRAINANLSTERDNLLAPQKLGERAEVLGLHVAKPGQIRRIGQENELPLSIEDKP